MSCLKTGFHGYLEPHALWVYGDAFDLSSVRYFRICQISDKPMQPIKHFTINNWEEWFDATRTSQTINSTMVCRRNDAFYYGYEGVPI